jgi:hypothetical protein
MLPPIHAFVDRREKRMTTNAPTMTRLIIILAVILAILTGCDDPESRRIDAWQGVVDQGLVQP